MTLIPTKMDRRLCQSIIIVLLVAASSAQKKDQGRWSRQISSYTSDISDWVPLSGPLERSDFSQQPIKRQVLAQPRILSEPFSGFGRPTGFNQEFPSRAFLQSPANRQLYLQSVPSAPQNFLNDQGFGQSYRFGLTQPNFPLSQGFIAPSFSFDGTPQIKQRPSISGPTKFDNFPPANLPVSPQAKPFVNQLAPSLSKQEPPKFIDGYRAENSTSTFTFPSPKRNPQSLQKLKQDAFEKLPKADIPAPSPLKSKSEREEVQLLYVPIDSLNRGQYSFKTTLNNPQGLGSDVYSMGVQKPNPLRQAFTTDFQRPITNPVENFSFGQDYYTNYNTEFADQVPKFSTVSSPFPVLSTTAKPKKLKPHQPPLAVFLAQEAKKGDKLKVSDVLISLKNEKSIAVLDTVSPHNSPKVFIGPSSLNPPENYVKFELPYLSNIEHSDKKLRQLPFFVAPLSYNTPNGFAKIPFPSPHVGSVIVNAQIKDNPSVSTPIADVYPNSYSASPPLYGQTKQTVTQKPTFSYFSTVPPKTNSPSSQLDNNYYSFEPQTVDPIRSSNQQSDHNTVTAAPNKSSYFLSNDNADLNSAGQLVNFPSHASHGVQYKNNFVKENKASFNSVSSSVPKTIATTASPTTARGTTSKSSSTYPSQLLETHNPYSINQAFHFSTPLDNQAYPEENRDRGVTRGYSGSSSTTRRPVQQENVKESYTSQPPSSTYLHNYSPEIQYGSEVETPRFPNIDTNIYNTKTELKPEVSSASIYSTENLETPTSAIQNNPVSQDVSEYSTPNSNSDILQGTRRPGFYEYNANSVDYKDVSAETTTTSTTTSTTTRRTPLRVRGRPHRYTTQRSENSESTSRSPVTRRPIKERKPLPSRNRYEPNKITTERTTRKQSEANDSTTKSSRMRIRGRVHYKSNENDSDSYEGKRQRPRGKEEDLAYQRDVLHQNYPVTLMERGSTIDIEAITEPAPRSSSTRQLNRDPVTEIYDSDKAYSAERSSISDYPDSNKNTESEIQTSAPRTQNYGSEASSYVPRLPSTRSDEYIYQSRSSPAQIDALSYSSNTNDVKQTQNVFTSRSTTPLPRNERPDPSIATESQTPVTEQALSRYSSANDYSPSSAEDFRSTGRPEFEITKTNSYEFDTNEQTTNEPQTTVPHNRLRVRTGSLKQSQTSSESTTTPTPINTKSEIRKRPVQAVTYRPSFDRRRTTMRIEEIEADLKTKPIQGRHDGQDYRHPVYKPEPTTEPAVTSVSSDGTTRRGQFRRRRPQNSYTTETSTERKKPTYEVKNRFRGRRPTEKPTEKTSQDEVTSTTSRNIPLNRYTQRQKLSERFNKRPIATRPREDQESETEDQDPNYSIHIPKYAIPEEKSYGGEKWSPSTLSETFKPYNPNEINDERKIATTERRTNDGNESELSIITARSDYDDILISVTPASNRLNKKIPDIPPTLEALVEQSKITNERSQDGVSTFESMLEEVMKSLEEQDEDEYTTNVMKHKGGEIGEIPPEKIISSGDNYAPKPTTISESSITTTESAAEPDTHEEKDEERKGRRRGFWKKVKVRPVTSESFEVAESQFYSSTVNRLGDNNKHPNEEGGKYVEKSKPTVTTYKPKISLKELEEPTEIGEVIAHKFSEIESDNDFQKTTVDTVSSTEKLIPDYKDIAGYETTISNVSPGELDLGTGTPDPSILDVIYNSPSTEPAKESSESTVIDRSDGFSIMDYLFGVTSPDKIDEKNATKQNNNPETYNEVNSEAAVKYTVTEAPKVIITTSDSTFIPEEFTTIPVTEEDTDKILTTEFGDIKKVKSTSNYKVEESTVAELSDTADNQTAIIETSSVSSFLDPKNVVSTSMSTEISHETEICFRGKCIKSRNNLL